MNIVHICLAAFYIEGAEYQENVLTRLHAQLGHNITVLTTEYVYDKKYNKVERENKDYINKYGVHVISLKKSKRYGWFSRFGDFADLYSIINNLNPHKIFVHGGQFIALNDILKYCKFHPKVDLYIDQHGDYYNMPVDNWKRKIVQKYIYGHFIRKSIKYCKKFWGVTPWRCDYLHRVYGIPLEKIELLVMGGDDEYIHLENKNQIRTNIRRDLNLDNDDFVIITGGKIDKTKNIHLLMETVSKLDLPKVKLIVFGEPNDSMSQQISTLAKSTSIRFLGWIASQKVYDYFLASDLAIFPGTHSVLWEQACACGIPCVFKDWEGMHHVDLGGNCVFLQDITTKSLTNVIKNIVLNRDKYLKMKDIASKYGIVEFSYNFIARKAIEIN